MIWQDIVLMIVGFGMSASLIPTFKARKIPSFATCLLTVLCLALVFICYGTLSLYLSAFSTLLTLFMWAIFLNLSWREKNANRTSKKI